ncbi:hypothetical protein T02_4669, partial [Trichinella nativa]
SGSRSSVIHSCRKYWNKAPTVPVVPASSSLTPVSTCVPAHRLSYVPPGRSGSSSPVPAYSGSSPESRLENKPVCSNIFTRTSTVDCWHQLIHHKGTDGKQLLIPLWYNLESTIHAPGSHGCLMSNIGTRSSLMLEPAANISPDDDWAVLDIALPGGCTSWTLPVYRAENSQMWMLFQKRLLFHFVCQVLIHRAAFDVIILLDHRCHIKKQKRLASGFTSLWTVIAPTLFEHFVPVLILLIQPVSDHVHSAVSVPMAYGWFYSVPFFSYWSLPSLFYWNVKSLSHWFLFYWAVKCLSYWFSLSNCSLIQTLQL